MQGGRARVLVFQPLFTHGAALDYRLLGFQYWVTNQMTAAGFEGVSALHRKDETGELSVKEAPSDSEIRSTLVEQGARFGILTSFVVLGGTPQLALARLVEARRGHPLRVLVRVKFDGDSDHLPAAAVELVTTILRRLGVEIEARSWARLFGTTDRALASSYLAALGCHSSCELGMPIDDPEAALRTLLSGVRAGAHPHIELLPHLVESLRESGSADTDMLAAAVQAAVTSVDNPPESWRSVMAALGVRARPPLIN